MADLKQKDSGNADFEAQVRGQEWDRHTLAILGRIEGFRSSGVFVDPQWFQPPSFWDLYSKWGPAWENPHTVDGLDRALIGVKWFGLGCEVVSVVADLGGLAVRGARGAITLGRAAWAGGARLLSRMGESAAARQLAARAPARVAQVTANWLRHEAAVADFVSAAERNGLKVLGTRVSVRTPFGKRVFDAVLEHPVTGARTGVEIKSTLEAFLRRDAFALRQLFADRYVSSYGAVAIGRKADIGLIQNTIKILWELP
jgi:hypothetical protein